ncbi:hypothetical protein RvY_13484-2 [Ramazzottius varieornatus]|uniref:Uncharacterized protein n=1 Tax=Ramazzottius varieornatus TaxID=947166 RepID=A0A1D1VS26_RAMVA|nr:hypothetical protein RvY_13484-2 [Ramazzottius varieornatus]
MAKTDERSFCLWDECCILYQIIQVALAAFIDHDECFLGLRTQPVQVECVHHLVAKMNAAQHKALQASQDASLDFLFVEYCRAFQAFLDCAVDDLTRKCGPRGRDLVLHTLYQVMGFEGRKRTCDVQIRSNDIFSGEEDITRLISFVP